jgi:hypothetical protein
MVEVFEQVGHRVGERYHICRQICAKKSSPCYPEREQSHSTSRIEWLSTSDITDPIIEHQFGFGSYAFRRSCKKIAMKRRLYESALAQPEITFSAEQAVAAAELKNPQDAALVGIVLAVILQNVFDVCGMCQKPTLQKSNSELNCVA